MSVTPGYQARQAAFRAFDRHRDRVSELATAAETLGMEPLARELRKARDGMEAALEKVIDSFEDELDHAKCEAAPTLEVAS